MDKWLEKWLKDEKPIDIGLMVQLTPHRYGIEYTGYEDGARDFLDLLRRIDPLPICNLGWTKRGFRLWDQEEEYVADAIAVAQTLDYADEDGSIGILDDAERAYGDTDKVFYTFNYKWGLFATQLSGRFGQFPRDYDLTAKHMIELVEVITRWKRPQHLEFGPSDYFHDHHPLDRARRGIRWIGWVPFPLNPSDVPEAALVQQMNGGTLIVTQMDFWQVFEHHPHYSKEAIERAQEVETRLDLLGVLPGPSELDKSDWGRA